MVSRIKTYQTSNKNFILKYFRCRDGKRTETRIGMEGICITHSCIPPLRAIMCCMYTVYSGMQEWVIQIPSIPILVSVLFPSLYLRIKFLLLVIDKNSQLLTTFITPFGRFKYLRAPYGISSISEYYNRRIDKAFARLTGYCRTIDDVVIYDSDTNQHFNHVQAFLQRCSERRMGVRQVSGDICWVHTVRAGLAIIELEFLAVLWAVTKCKLFLAGLGYHISTSSRITTHSYQF